MGKLLLLLTICLPGISGFSLNDGLKSGRMSGSAGFIDITVLSNIDKQYFQYNFKQQSLSIIKEPETGYSSDTSKSRIIIPVKVFQCNNRLAYKDFLTLLKAEQFPDLEIDISLNSGFETSTDDSVILKSVTVMAAGVSNQYDISCRIDNRGNDNQVLNGTIRIKLTDLGIIPPVKLMGLVKVKNEIIINFEFSLRYVFKL